MQAPKKAGSRVGRIPGRRGVSLPARGFTFAELMVVMVVVLILTALAYPSYSNFVITSRRTEGQVALLEALQQQERYYTRHNTYILFSSSSTDPDARKFKWWSGSIAGESAYELSGRECPGVSLQRCIELHAEPGTAKVNQAFRDERCATLVLHSSGESHATGPEPRCWP